VLLTRNYDDFAELHDVVQAAHGTHHGILVVRLDNDPRRDMTDRGVVKSNPETGISERSNHQRDSHSEPLAVSRHSEPRKAPGSNSTTSREQRGCLKLPQ
jgi:hypothetical protein